MKGELMKPSISFNIVLPEGNNSVSTEIINTTQAKLTQLRQQQMNQQTSVCFTAAEPFYR
jgi:hypothetical protein